MKLRQIPLLLALLAGPAAAQELAMEQVASFDQDRPTAAVSDRSGRIFVSLPFGPFSGERHVASVVEVTPDGTTRAYPDDRWNSKDPAIGATARFLNVQSLTVDDAGRLWVLDTGSPRRAGIVPGGAKLVEIETATNKVLRTVPIGGPDLLRQDSYPNDVRVDARRGVAYLTDSAHGGILVVDLATGSARMLLADPVPAVVLAEKRRAGTVEGISLAAPDGGPQSLATDGLALSGDRDTLFFTYRPFAGSHRLYSIRTEYLLNHALSPIDLARRVRDAGPAVITDGIEHRDDVIFYSDLERNAVACARPGEEPRIVVRSNLFSWPDGIGFEPDGSMLVAVAQFHRLAPLNAGINRSAPPFMVHRVRAKGHSSDRSLCPPLK